MVVKSKTNKSLSFFCGLFLGMISLFQKKKKKFCFVFSERRKQTNEMKQKRSVPLKKELFRAVLLAVFSPILSLPEKHLKKKKRGWLWCFPLCKKSRKCTQKLGKWCLLCWGPSFFRTPTVKERKKVRDKEFPTNATVSNPWPNDGDDSNFWLRFVYANVPWGSPIGLRARPREEKFVSIRDA